ncbi:molybdopterin-dependent oxidoreductase [Duganella sp. FT135W]|uniref:Molybdopterin-dependent oxidoreductase n=1 Tax=Duganella flavida TaxID=2692175 RepID=A0A6L8K9R8_9BURK|nr:molybdopterin-dependent oxidoreductase [Duganella flavida]MYM22968.1 molybdopterin-dependent oxidoreductase [Duganella flavida]
MKKRQFLGTAALAGLSAAIATPVQAAASGNGPTLLTVTGAIGVGNRGKLDPVRDQMMYKQKLSFDKAYGFDFAALIALPAITIKPTLEYDGKPHTLRGPLLLDVMKATGAKLNDNTRLVLRAIDAFAATVTVAQAKTQRYIVATHLDGAPMALGGLGPLWAVYDADKVPEMAAKPVSDRFGLCPWGLYHISVD